MATNKKYVELLWAEKYDNYEKSEKIPIEKPNLPFQVVETVDFTERTKKSEKFFSTTYTNHNRIVKDSA